MTEAIQNGSPWKHCLEITELEPGRLRAGVGLTHAKWIWPTVAISAIIALALGYGSFNALGQGNIGGGIAAAVFACLAVVVAVFALGCLTYTVGLKIDGNTVTFGCRFFWITKGTRANKEALGYLKCWAHSIGSGSARSHHLHVCLHPLPSLPVISLYSKDYLPHIKRTAGEAMGISSDALSEEEAVHLVLSKADEIASCLEIEHRAGSDN